MNKFKFYFILLFSGLILFSCNKSDDATVIPIRDLKTQYDADLITIKTYMKTHYVKSLNLTPGTIAEMDVKIEKIPEGNPEAVTSLWNRTDKDSTTVERHGFIYTIYYLKFRLGDVTKDNPSRVDNVLVAYDGSYLTFVSDSEGEKTDATQFEYTPFPSQFIGLDSFITGWTEVMRLFKPGTPNIVEGQPTVYNDFGAGVMFIPCGLGYFNLAQSTIPSYSPLVFSFKLYDMKRSDPDGDGILSINEDLNGNGIFTDDDTDGDGIPNYRDSDDDGDGVSTLVELKKPVEYLNPSHANYSGPALYYPYEPISYPDTPERNETWGAPRCNPQTSADYLDPTRIRKYLDRSCQ